MIKKGLAILALLAGFGTCACADTIWYLNDVTFDIKNYLGVVLSTNAATGMFTVSGSTTLSSWDVTVTGTDTQANYHYSSALNPNNSGFVVDTTDHIDFFAQGGNLEYLILKLSAPLANGSPDPLLIAGSATLACPGCSIGVTGSVSLTDPAVPEPSAILLLGTVVGLAGLTVRRKPKLIKG